MKKNILAVLILFSVTGNTFGQREKNIETEIRALEQMVTTAILNGDTATLIKVWAPEFLVNNPRNSITGNRDSVLILQKAGLLNYSRFERVTERIQFQKKLVITMGLELIVSRQDIPGVKAGEVYRRRFTNVWMKKSGKWKQIARHASIICQ